MDEAAGGVSGRPPSGSMEECVEEFLRSVRNGKTSNMNETISTEHALGTHNKASHSAVQKTKKKNKTVMKPAFHCKICNVSVCNAVTFQAHTNGKKHKRRHQFFSEIHVGVEYIRRYEHPGGIRLAKCVLCCEQMLDVSNHLKSYSHILAVLKAEYPKVFENIQHRGLNNIKTDELKRIVLAEMFPELFQRYDYLDNPGAMENLVREKDSNLFHHEEKGNASGLRQIRPDCQKYLECTARCDPKPIGSESPLKITCNKDLYTFLQYFQISDEMDVIFIQQIVQKLKRQLQEFNENDQQVATISELIDGKDQAESISKFNFSRHSESILQHADSTTTSTVNESTANKSADIEDHSKGECRTHLAGNSQLCSNMSGRRLKDVHTVDHLPEYNSSKVTTTQATASNSLSSHRSSVMLCRTTKKPMIRPSVSTSVLKSSIASIKNEPDDASVEEPQLDCTTATTTTERVVTATVGNPVSLHRSSVMLCPTTKKPMIRPSVSTSVLKSHHQSIASIKNEPDDATVEEPQLDCTTATITTERVVTATASNPVSSHRSSVMLCPTTKKPMIRPSVSTSVLKSSIASIKNEPDDASVEEPQLDSTTATTTTEHVVTGTTGSHLPVFYSSGSLSTGKPKCIIRPSVLSSVLKKSFPLESHVSDKNKPDTLASDQHHASPEGCIGPTKVQSHCSVSEFGKDQPPSSCLFLSEEEDSKFDPAANKPRIDYLNLPTSTSHRHAAAGISFGGKKNMQISELIAEVAKFADTKPVLKGIDINQVVQILIRNRNEKTRNKSQDSTE
ncbi:uncharacterized protein LOC143782318 isoform X1 [Ranitomeya variabilis]|uniref:uncharacterized protein LOC143782318 isoform X1 n=1 Tax=Ranitomeya variabilis TaxID=490064 RepID=UPI0040560EAC